MSITARKVLMETEAEFCEFPQAFDGMADVQDAMDAEYEWLDATITDLDVKYYKGTNRIQAVVIRVAWDFAVADPRGTETDDEPMFK